MYDHKLHTPRSFFLWAIPLIDVFIIVSSLYETKVIAATLGILSYVYSDMNFQATKVQKVHNLDMYNMLVLRYLKISLCDILFQYKDQYTIVGFLFLCIPYSVSVHPGM